MITSLYAALAALLIVRLSFHVIKIRRRRKVRLGDDGDFELLSAIRAQGNATEYIPVTLILMIVLELNHVHGEIIHAGGMAMLAGRLLHSHGLITDKLNYRVLGMQFTFVTIIALALTNLVYFFANSSVVA